MNLIFEMILLMLKKTDDVFELKISSNLRCKIKRATIEINFQSNRIHYKTNFANSILTENEP